MIGHKHRLIQACSTLEPEIGETLVDEINEYTLDLFSRVSSFATRQGSTGELTDFHKGIYNYAHAELLEELVDWLITIYCWDHVELLDVWKQARPSTKSTRKDMFDEIISLTCVATRRWKIYLDYCLEEGGKVADAANNILSAMITRSPALARSICDDFSRHYEWWCGDSLLLHANRQTIDIMKQAGADSLSYTFSTD
jgi:hypothetical protein